MIYVKVLTNLITKYFKIVIRYLDLNFISMPTFTLYFYPKKLFRKLLERKFDT